MVIATGLAYLVSFESAYTLSSLWSCSWHHSSWGCELPHLDSLVQTAANKVSAIWCKSNTVNTVSMAVRALKTLNKVSSGGIPDADTLIKRPSCHIAAVWGDGNGGDAVLDAEDEFLLAINNIPETDGLIATS